MIKPVYWYDLLTLDHTVCTLCFARGLRKATHPSMQIGGMTLMLESNVKGPAASRKHRAGYIAALRARALRHLATEHPEQAVRKSRVL